MAHNHDIVLKPPFKTITQYENEFIRLWNNNLSSAIADVLKYMARITASETKDLKKSEDPDFQKAHVVGDEKVVNGRTYVYSRTKSGTSYTWRVKEKKERKKSTSDRKPWDKVSGIEKCKSADECVKFLSNEGVISKHSNFNGISKLEDVKRICTVLYNVHNMFNADEISIVTSNRMDSSIIADAYIGHRMRLNLRYFTNWNDQKNYIGSYGINETRKNDLDRLLKKEKDLKDSGQYNDHLGRGLTQKIKELKEAIEKYPCWTYGGDKTRRLEYTILHELGHIINSQCSGSCGAMVYWSGKRDSDYIDKCKKLNDEHKELFFRYKDEKSCLSQYSTVKRAECFAEGFVAYVMKEPKMPKYLKDYYDKYFKETKPVNVWK